MNKVYLTGLLFWTEKVGVGVELIPKKSNGWVAGVVVLLTVGLGLVVKSISIISNMLFDDFLGYCFDTGGEDSVLTRTGVVF